jgi:hypothetical protein
MAHVQITRGKNEKTRRRFVSVINNFLLLISSFARCPKRWRSPKSYCLERYVHGTDTHIFIYIYIYIYMWVPIQGGLNTIYKLLNSGELTPNARCHLYAQYSCIYCSRNPRVRTLRNSVIHMYEIGVGCKPLTRNVPW